jgi:hypothetical protein
LSTASTTISLEQAHRVAIRAQALDGSVRTVLDCMGEPAAKDIACP